MVNKTDARVRTRLSVEDRREQLLEVALGLIATRPWDELTMAEVASAAGVSKPLLYHYYLTKTELYVGAIARAADDLQRSTAPDPALPAEERVRAALDAYLSWIEHNSLAYRAIIQGGASAHVEVRSIVERSRAEVIDRIALTLDGQAFAPALRIGLRGWAGFLEMASLDWLRAHDLPKADMITLLARALAATIRGASRVGRVHVGAGE